MAYAVAQDFVDMFGETEARQLAASADRTTYDAVKIDERLGAASAVLDSYFATRYSVPLSSVPEIVKVYALALAREALDRGGRADVKAEADRARAWARDISKGIATLGVNLTAPDAPTAAGDGAILIDAEPRVFDGDGLAGFLGGRR